MLVRITIMMSQARVIVVLKCNHHILSSATQTMIHDLQEYL